MGGRGGGPVVRAAGQPVTGEPAQFERGLASTLAGNQMAESALIVRVPEAEAWVGPIRDRFDASRRHPPVPVFASLQPSCSRTRFTWTWSRPGLSLLFRKP